MNEYLSYAIAKEFVKKLKLSSYIDWIHYTNVNSSNLPKLPTNIPSKPDKVYKGLGWINWEDWLGSNDVMAAIPNSIIQTKNYDNVNIKTALFDTTSIEILRIQFQLSVRAYNVCLFNDLKTLKDLLQHYSIANTFKNLRNCGVKTAQELTFIVNNVESIETENPSFENNNPTCNAEDPNLYDIINPSDLSRRAYNCCLSRGLTTRKLLIEYLKSNGSFLNLMNCGINTNVELINFSKIPTNNLITNSSFIKTILPKIQNNFLFLSEDYFDVLKNNFELTEISKKYLSRNKISNAFKFLRIYVNSDGYSKTLVKTEFFQFTEYILKIVWMKDSELYSEISDSTRQDVFEFSSYLLRNRFIDNESLFKVNIPNAFYLKTFNFLELIHFHTHTYNARDYEILYNRIFGNVTKITLAELGIKLNITRERVRQIATNEERRITRRIKRLLGINQFIMKYISHEMKLSGLALITSSTFDDIRAKSKVHFSNDFILFILSLINSKTHVIETLKDNLWVAIPNNIGFDISQFKKRLDDLISDATYKLKRFNFEVFISQFTVRTDVLHLQDLCNFLKGMLADHYDIYVIDNQVDLTDLKKRLNYQDIEDVLKEVDRPMKVAEIEEYLNKKFSNLFVSRTNLLRLLRENTKIIHIGRTSTFGLLAWEHDRLFKGGTIRDIVYDFLKNKDAPIHISVIEKHVNLYRKTNQKNILYNLKLEKQKRFRFLKDGFIQTLK